MKKSCVRCGCESLKENIQERQISYNEINFKTLCRLKKCGRCGSEIKTSECKKFDNFHANKDYFFESVKCIAKEMNCSPLLCKLLSVRIEEYFVFSGNVIDGDFNVSIAVDTRDNMMCGGYRDLLDMDSPIKSIVILYSRCFPDFFSIKG